MNDSRARENDVFLQEYSSHEAILRYTASSAGSGIAYLLEHDYAQVYTEALNQHLKCAPSPGLRVLEFGCGGGMNVIAVVGLLFRQGHPLEVAYGTDFSDVLVTAANADKVAGLPLEQQEKLSFHVARNENLAPDLSQRLSIQPSELLNSFHFILGVNTFRYCHRLSRAAESARDIFDLLAPGGVCVMIDMNSRFPAFRSRLRQPFTKPGDEGYLPSLEEYSQTFQQAGFEIVARTTFCWIPHSAGPWLTRLCRLFSPLLTTIARPLAMRCLVISRKSVPSDPTPAGKNVGK